ncbi:sulfurtransferase [Planococcus sp. N064]|uniref:Sulfurtransferase n=1 Tax=Planococcus liqunii TaxID=3058394 RepID=A0ABT8MLL3_9BACL|nr:sulfurtransferase [Planococcus sp. N064]MDN7225771.1 sulfurtransferase [Planococcus sp. N064]
MTVFIKTTDTEKYRWIDARFDLQHPETGREQYAKQHVEGAIHWDLNNDLSDMASNAGRHPMPSKEQVAELIKKSGLAPEDEVVVYDQGGTAFAARAWWLLKYAGFEKVYISKLGFEALKKQGIRVSNELPEYPSSNPELKFNESIYADQEDVKNIIDGKELGVLVDARSPKRFAGIEEPIDPVAGRIPGAHNFDLEQLVKNKQFIEDADFSSVLHKNEPAVVYCGSGVSAAGLYAVLAEKGHESLRLYTGSFSDWIRNEDNVVEIDTADMPEPSDDDSKDILARLIEEGYSGEMLMKKFEYEKSLIDKKE